MNYESRGRRIPSSGRDARNREGNRRRGNGKRPWPVWLLVLIDIVAIGVFLCVFSYFHHVNPIQNNMKPVELPAHSTSPTQENPQVEPPVQEPTQTEGQVPETPEQTPEGADVFLAAGEEPVETETSYTSENVHVEVRTEETGDVTYHIAEVYVQDVQYLKTALAGGSYDSSWQNRAYVNELGAEVNAFVALNGDQCTGHKEGVVVRNGVLYRDVPYKDVCILHYDGTLETVPQGEFDLEALKEEGAWQVWSFGPMLLEDGQPMTTFNSDVQGANPRSAIGMIEPGHYILLSVDGRGESSGMTLEELSQLFYDLGCVTAYNLDGGDTSAMALGDEIYSNPSGERKATDILYVGRE